MVLGEGNRRDLSDVAVTAFSTEDAPDKPSVVEVDSASVGKIVTDPHVGDEITFDLWKITVSDETGWSENKRSNEDDVFVIKMRHNEFSGQDTATRSMSRTDKWYTREEFRKLINESIEQMGPPKKIRREIV